MRRVASRQVTSRHISVTSAENTLQFFLTLFALMNKMIKKPLHNYENLFIEITQTKFPILRENNKTCIS